MRVPRAELLGRRRAGLAVSITAVRSNRAAAVSRIPVADARLPRGNFGGVVI